MNEQYEKVKSALIELRNASITCSKNEQGIRSLINKYDIIFSGEKLNTILTIELVHSLETKFDIQITHEELCRMIPKLCNQLGMTYTSLYPVDEVSEGIINSEHVAYHIHLY